MIETGESTADSVGIAVDRVTTSTYTIPAERPESDGTAGWDSTTIIVVEAGAGGQTGLGYTYGHPAVATVIQQTLARVAEGWDALSVGGPWAQMGAAVRNAGRPGVAAMAISAVDSALWDLKARLLGVPLVTLLGQCRTGVAVYGSGGFTSLSNAELETQLGTWAAQGIPRVKMKVGRDPDADLERVRTARQAIGPGCELFVDANGAFQRKAALRFADELVAHGVSWFEEPVSSDDLDGLRLLRDRAPAQMDIAAGEYGFTSWYFERMLRAGAVDCLQADCTRCQGITGFLQAAALCQAHNVELSAHCGPTAHAHVCCAAPAVRHVEYFADHVRVESLVFDGVLEPQDGELRPDLSRPGNGLSFNREAAERAAVQGAP